MIYWIVVVEVGVMVAVLMMIVAIDLEDDFAIVDVIRIIDAIVIVIEIDVIAGAVIQEDLDH